MSAAGRWSCARARRAGRATACRTGSGAAAGRFDVRALALIRETLAWHDGLADFAFAMQGLGSGAISLAGSEELQRRYLPRGCERRGDGRVRAVRACRGLGCRSLAVRRAPRRRGVRAGRRKDLDLQRRHRRLLLRVRAHQPRGGAPGRHRRRPRHQRLRGRCQHPRLHDRAAHRPAGPASPGAARLQRLPRTGGQPARRRGRRLQDRHAHAGCLSHLRRRGRAGLCAARPR